MGDEKHFRWFGWIVIFSLFIGWMAIIGTIVTVKWLMNQCARISWYEQQESEMK